MLRVLDAAHVRRWAVACVQSLDAHREAIDLINVFPVPDSDTGSNLLYTMRAALDALLRASAPARTDAGAALTALARGALTGARGNSGVIASQLLRGMADGLLTGGGGATGPMAREDTGGTGTSVAGGAANGPGAGPGAGARVDAAAGTITGAGLRAALAGGAEQAGAALAEPVAGTMVSEIGRAHV